MQIQEQLVNAVLQDAQERFNTPELMLEMAADEPANISVQIESIESIIWNECGLGSGPSFPMRGTCLNINVSGWRVVVVGGGSSTLLRLVYYIPQGVDVGAWTPQPDGLQSLSEAIQRQILTQVAEQAGVPISTLHLFWADARFFDRCLNSLNTHLNTHKEVPSYGMDIRPGWAVQILVNSITPSVLIQQPLWIYHTNMTGTDVHLVSQEQWIPFP